jgi:hypothetical protein
MITRRDNALHPKWSSSDGCVQVSTDVIVAMEIKAADYLNSGKQ